MTPDEELDHLEAELKRAEVEHSNGRVVLRLTDKCLRRCSTWKWEQHGWTTNDGLTCDIMNGNEQSRRTALMSVLKGQIDAIEFVPGLEKLEVAIRP